MFIGHYGPAFAGKAATPRVPLWVLFIAVQWLDVFWSVFILTGIEKVRIVPGFMAGSSLDLYYMPYTHGLAGALALSALLGLLVVAFYRVQRSAVFWVVFLCVFSHWLLDLVVHAPDLWIYDGVKLGFGLWRWLWISLPLELASLVVGAVLYARYVPARTFGNLALWIFVALMAGVEIYAVFGPPPASPAAEAKTALLAYVALAFVAAGVDWARKPARARLAPGA
jgi:hypothetical protein